MTAPDNNDAALVREALERGQGYSGTDIKAHEWEALDRLAATAERADEAERLADSAFAKAEAYREAAVLAEQLQRAAESAAPERSRDSDLSGASAEGDEAGSGAAGLQAALLVAQQERDDMRKAAAGMSADLSDMGRAYERAEATITRLREALERIADSHASFTEMQEAARAALAQDAEQANA